MISHGKMPVANPGLHRSISHFQFSMFLCLSGVSIDLVCLAEQPLHTVPLLKYFSKVLGQRDANLADDYNIPHWMNHNFYASPKTRNKVDNYVPRIKVPEIVLNSLRRRPEGGKGESFLLFCLIETKKRFPSFLLFPPSSLRKQISDPQNFVKVLLIVTFIRLKSNAPEPDDFRHLRQC